MPSPTNVASRSRSVRAWMSERIDCIKEIGRGGWEPSTWPSGRTRRSISMWRSRSSPATSPHPSLIHRFLEERRILATLDHPNIARVLDAGATADGLPFVVMEYVDGTAIDVHCREQRVDRPAAADAVPTGL